MKIILSHVVESDQGLGGILVRVPGTATRRWHLNLDLNDRKEPARERSGPRGVQAQEINKHQGRWPRFTQSLVCTGEEDRAGGGKMG